MKLNKTKSFLRKALCPTVLIFSSLSGSAYSIFIDNRTGWENAFVYVHNNGFHHFGDWPGKHCDRHQEVEGINYEVYDIPSSAEGLDTWMQYNNGNQKIYEEIHVDLNADRYFLATLDGLSEKETPGETPLTDFTAAIEENGGIRNDLSGSKKIVLDEPSLAYVNISGISAMPTQKTDEMHAWLEYFDAEGNYFKKRIILGAQGSSSLYFPKRNCKFDICEDEWLGDKTTDVTFGNWVKQDGFHLKAFFVDYFRGLGEVNYKLYDEVVADRGDMAHAWQRAGIADADKNAKGHPDGFPAIVCLNGKFYGVFAWQLKKHRKNMGMDKNTPEHIHLDGEIGYAEIFNPEGTVKWTSFEIRNPKGLYCQNGAKYDGDNHQEIMDENSTFYDPSNEDHVRTAKVKSYIKKLARYYYVLDRYQKSGYSKENMRQEIADRLDIESFLDYTVFSAVIDNWDGYWKNWQWTTYDGHKWALEPYDLDVTFGNIPSGLFVTPAEYNHYSYPPYSRFRTDHGINVFFHEYFEEDINERYCQLRRSGVFSVENIMNKINNWYERIGEDNYNKEYTRWPESLCNRDLILDPSWEWTGTWVNLYNTAEWNAHTQYKKGQLARTGDMLFIAKEDNRNHYPVQQFGYHDSLDRVREWITKRLQLQDGFMNYDDIQNSVDGILDEDSNMTDENIVTIHDLYGISHDSLQPGINIVTYSNGKTKKVIK